MSDRHSLGYSPCPNDTFIFYALVHDRLEDAPCFREVLEDIETLNGMAARSELDVVKVSFHALGHLRDHYALLHAGGALGRGCGPLVVARDKLSPEELHTRKVAIPGRNTTAALLVRLFAPQLTETVEIPFHRIMDAVGKGEVDAGVIIHESRFTYARCGLREVIDLGQWWEDSTGHAIPLGGIAACRNLGTDQLARIDDALRRSVLFAHANPDEVHDYVAAYAQEMEREVMKSHIELYVNDYTTDYGANGEEAIAHLMERAQTEGVIEPSEQPLFY
ncbi:MAG: 1,4-dihydroxy-6-naphthoate synthase [Candidatus Latescibacterota bacterium]|nr:1,4-dihydroxy-6-naphthoate synthase [Candidatus Latescibacterota bacterium]